MGENIRMVEIHSGEIPNQVRSAKRAATLVYAVQAASFFLGGITLLVGVVVNYVKRPNARNTWLESHFRWQIRTFWFGLLWALLGLPIGFLTLGMDMVRVPGASRLAGLQDSEGLAETDGWPGNVRESKTEMTGEYREPPVYLICELCGQAFSPLKVKPDQPAWCPACAKEERDYTIDRCSPTQIREKTLQRKTRESKDAVARRLKGTSS